MILEVKRALMSLVPMEEIVPPEADAQGKVPLGVDVQGRRPSQEGSSR